jgi:hypothetical protein
MAFENLPSMSETDMWNYATQLAAQSGPPPANLTEQFAAAGQSLRKQNEAVLATTLPGSISSGQPQRTPSWPTLSPQMAAMQQGVQSGQIAQVDPATGQNAVAPQTDWASLLGAAGKILEAQGQGQQQQLVQQPSVAARPLLPVSSIPQQQNLQIPSLAQLLTGR